MADPSCKGYSQVIIEWAKNLRRKVDPFKTAHKEESIFEEDLEDNNKKKKHDFS